MKLIQRYGGDESFRYNSFRACRRVVSLLCEDKLWAYINRGVYDQITSLPDKKLEIPCLGIRQ